VSPPTVRHARGRIVNGADWASLLVLCGLDATATPRDVGRYVEALARLAEGSGAGETPPSGDEAERAVKEHARRELWTLCETLSQAFAGDLDVDRSVVESFVYGVQEFLRALAPKAGA
jgi:hypothetical protein